MNILFLQGAHSQYDDRVYYHQRLSLLKLHHKVDIRSYQGQKMPFWKLVLRIREDIHSLQAEVVICDLPKMVVASVGCRVRLIYDITEWYPSRHILRNSPVLGLVKWLPMKGLNFIAGCLADCFIFGEEDKSIIFRRLFPCKKHIFLPYYPSKIYIPRIRRQPLNTTCRLFYGGSKRIDKGWHTVQQTLQLVRQLRPDIQWELIVIEPKDYLPLPDFCERLKQVDICLDLREVNGERNRSLPIKLFYYMAAGCPCVYSDLAAIRKHIPEINSCCQLVTTAIRAAQAIVQFLDSKAYIAASRAGQTLLGQKYNWESIEQRLKAIL